MSNQSVKDGYTKYQEKLRKYTDTIKNNLYYALTSNNLSRKIGENADAIKESKLHRSLFYIQRPLINDVILSITKIFEDSDNALTLKKTYNYLNSNQRQLEAVNNRKESFKEYTHFDLSSLPSPFATRDLVPLISRAIDKLYEEYQSDLYALKSLRDRQLAHSDGRDVGETTTWEKVDDLLLFISEFLDLINFVFLSIIESFDGEPAMGVIIYDSKRPSISFDRLMKKAGILPDES